MTSAATDTTTRHRLLRPRNVLLALALLALAGITAALIPVYRISTAVPGASGEHVEALRQLVAERNPEAPDSRNASILLQRAADTADAVTRPANAAITEEADERFDGHYSVGGVDGTFVYKPFEDSTDLEVTDARRQRIRDVNAFVRQKSIEALREMDEAGVPDLLDAAAEADTARVHVPDRPLAGMQLEAMAGARMLARWEAGRLMLAAEQGDWPEAHRASRRLLAIASAMSETPSLLGQLVAIAIEDLACSRMIDAVVSHAPPSDAISEFRAIFAAAKPRAPIAYAFEAERLQLLDYVEHTHSDDGDGSGFFLPVENVLSPAIPRAGPSSPSIRNVKGLFRPRKAATVAAINDYFDTILAAAELPRAHRLASPDPSDQIPPDQEMLALLTTAHWHVYRSLDRLTSNRAGLETVLAIELHRAQRADLPEDLDALVPDFLPELPHDPFAPDGRLIYRPDPDSPHGYLLYSVSDNAADDGGFHPETRSNSDQVDHRFVPPVY